MEESNQNKDSVHADKTVHSPQGDYCRPVEVMIDAVREHDEESVCHNQLLQMENSYI